MVRAIEPTDSIFADLGIRETVRRLAEAVRTLYVSDAVPWVIGYSGGKDSTATLQLVWLAIKDLAPEDRQKPIHVISTDTLVENPIVSAWVGHSLEQMNQVAKSSRLPFLAHQLTPEIQDTFWVNLIGKGYPAPRHKFRWCTERLKIKPSNRFIRNVVQENGEAILVLGTRKAESKARARTMTRLEEKRTKAMLSPNASLPNSLVFTPIEDWSNDDVWLFLMQVENPWGYRNKDLLTMYQGASADGECPLVVDSSTPSCGDSRFGCWVCTLVEKDRSMQAMIQNDQEKEWMLPLLELRNDLDIADDRHLRDFRRMTGSVQLFHNRPIPGPYTKDAREMWLRRVLEAQQWIRHHGPEEIRTIELISRPELDEIRRIWTVEKHEIEDTLPQVYEEVCGQPYSPSIKHSREVPFGRQDLAELRELCGDDLLHYELTRNLVSIQWKYRTFARRTGIFEQIDRAIRRGFYDSEEDAMERARNHEAVLVKARNASKDESAHATSKSQLVLLSSSNTKKEKDNDS